MIHISNHLIEIISANSTTLVIPDFVVWFEFRVEDGDGNPSFIFDDEIGADLPLLANKEPLTASLIGINNPISGGQVSYQDSLNVILPNLGNIDEEGELFRRRCGLDAPNCRMIALPTCING